MFNKIRYSYYATKYEKESKKDTGYDEPIMKHYREKIQKILKRRSR